MEQKKTLVLGASENPARYSNMAIKSLSNHGQPVVAIGNKHGNVGDIEIIKDTPKIDDIHTITLYLNPSNQKPYYDYILTLNPKRVIFNPGTENDELILALRKQGIQAIEACTLVMLNTGQF
jgi:predicted CoA-binding protein